MRKRHRPLVRLIGVLGAALLVGVPGTAFSGTASAASPAGQPAPLVAAEGQSAIPGRYVVVLRSKPSGKAAAPPAAAVARARAEGVRVERVYGHALTGYAAELSPAQLTEVRSDPDVAYVAEDGYAQLDGTQSPATWGLDRVNQTSLPLDNTYTDNATGAGVTAFVIDSGIRATHTQFGGRVSGGADFVGDGNGTNDCRGHGTHVAGTIGGSTYGVAEGVSLVPVRVFGCSGSSPFSTVIAGVDWVTAHHSGPSVANMSLSGGAYQPLDDAVNNSINSGVVYAVAAGNSNDNACNYSPARTPAAITVGASTSADSRDTSYSDYGSCVTLFAPGTGITSAWIGSDTATNTIDGTSMATPHVAGVAALYLQGRTGVPPATVKRWITDAATPGVLSNIGTGSPNRLLYSVPVFGSSIAAARNDDGRLEMFGTNNGDDIWHRFQTTAGSSSWSGWSQFDGALRSVAAETNADGRVELFGVNSAGNIWHRWQTSPGGSWSGWSQLDGALTSIAVARNQDGRLEIFGTNSAGNIWHRFQTTAGSSSWSGWSQFDGALTQVAAETNADGRVELFGVNSAGDIWHRWQTSPGGSWSGWSQFDGALASIAVARNQDGRLEIFGTNSAGNIWHRFQTTAGSSSWSGWSQFDGALTQVAAETNADGRIELFGVNGAGNIWHRSQTTPAGSWSGWSQFDGALRP
ncbi:MULTISPECIES: S8 family serine peptidase [Streptomyces]|uniref:S8 family serine peptidase n=2 Tax=Streptomyces TaxID=1883 RepID=A0ABV9J2P8_9ACTN